MTIQVSAVADQDNLGISQRIDRTAYLANLLALRSPLPSPMTALQSLRDAATAQVQELAMPSTREEDWRFTDLSPLLAIAFSSPPTVEPPDASLLEPLILPEAAPSHLVFVDGQFVPGRSQTAGLPAGVFAGNLAEALVAQPQLREYLATQPGGNEVFTALNTASFTDAAVIWVGKGVQVEAPIQLVFLSSQGNSPTLSQPRCLVVAESNSSLTLVETYGALQTGVYCTNPVTEIWVEANAQVNHTRVQQDTQTAFHIGKTAVSVQRDARYNGIAISLGASLSRHNLEVFQQGEQTEIGLSCLTLLAGEQVGDTHSAIAYSKPYGSSRQLHKCIVDDHAHAVFNGRISVPKPAQLTDAGQLSKTLLLSPKARVDTKPQLEIVADNVKCSHGATVSQLENDEIFYLQSRGIDGDSARKLLVYAFAGEVIGQIPVASLRDRLTQHIRLLQA